MRKTLLLLIPVLLGGCTWGITMDEAAKNVRTAWNGDVSACHELGKVTVSVMDHIGPVNRNGMTVREELEVMARNEAAKMHADTVKPLAEPADGSQAWGVYQCGTRTINPVRSTTSPTTTPAPGSAQTFPVKGN
jgi:hypothetical protein